MTTMKDALRNAGVALTPEEELKEAEQEESRRRSKIILERPKNEVKLYSLYDEPVVKRKVSKDPTGDLMVVPVGMTNSAFRLWMQQMAGIERLTGDSFLIICQDTMQAWFAESRLVLDMNFIYRNDLQIVKINNSDTLCEAAKLYAETAATYNPNFITRKTCYILDAPANETYEVYYDTSYPAVKYGKATPNGMFVHKYENRFHRDMAIMELDDLYTNHSSKDAGKLTKRDMRQNEAIVVSDGAWMNNVCSSAHYYLDSSCLMKLTSGFLPSEQDQAVLISEIVGATQALRMCYANGKKCITYYYDNTSIINVFRNRKTEYIHEVVEYKELIEKMDAEGYEVTFVELHPKTGEDRTMENRALMFFHNYCDKECRDMADIFKKDYKDLAAMGSSTSGKSFKQVKQEFKPKGRPGQPNGSGQRNNSNNGNNRYGRRM